MVTRRIIPTLLLKDGGIVKGEQFKKHQYIGDPINAVKIFNDSEADEITILDISCTINNKEPDYALIKEIASEAFMPLSYGGGLNQIEHVRKVFHLGVEKVVFNTAAYEKPALINNTAKEFGSSSTVVSIDVKSGLLGGKKAYVRNGSKSTNLDPVEYAKKMEDLGAGELLLTSIDREGKMKGYDLELIAQIAKATKIPVIANGGAGSLTDIKQSLQAGASAASAGSLFVFVGKIKGILINYPNPQQLREIIEF